MNRHFQSVSQTNSSTINIQNQLQSKNTLLQDFRLLNQKLEAIQKTVYSNKISTTFLYALLVLFLLSFFLNHGGSLQNTPNIQTFTSNPSALQTQINNLKKVVQEMDQTLEFLFKDYKTKVYNTIEQNLKSLKLTQGTQRNINKEKLSFVLYLQKLNHGKPLIGYTDRTKFNQFKNDITKKQYYYYDFKQQQPICVIVPTWENAADFRYQRNLISILNQNYTNFKVHIAVDLSDDPTYYLLSRYLRKNNINENKVTLLKRTQRSFMMKNRLCKLRKSIYIIQTARNYCKPNEIIAIVQGDDALLGVNVFNVLNTLYTRNKLGIVYSNNLIYNNRDREIVTGDSYAFQPQTIQNQDYRKVNYRHSHVRTFRAELLFSIKQQDLRKQGQYIKVGSDNFILYPIEQMSCKKVLFVNQMFAFVNRQTNNNQYQTSYDKQREMESYVRSLPKYECHKDYI